MSNIEQFASVTGSDNETAKQFLEMAGGDLETAISLYFENAGSVPAPSTAPQQQVPQGGARRLGSGGQSDYVAPAPAPAPKLASAAPAAKGSAPKSKFASLSDFKEEEEDEGKENRYYAGGSKNSGQQILGGDDDREDDLTSKIFKSAQERGAQQVEDPKQKPKEKFSGSGSRLGSTPSESKPATTPQAVPPQLKKPQQQEEEDEKTITLTFYEDGFTIDNGELRRLDDPKNKAFLEAIHAGYVPREISGGAKNVAVNLVKQPGKYVPPPKTFKAFEGSGKALGVTGASSSSSAQAPKATPVSSSQQTSSTTSAPAKVADPPVDLGKPHTTIQIRLADGSRLVAKFNLDDTVKSVYKYASQATPGKKFVLMTTFPRKEFTDESQTISAAGLNNAALSQILK